MSQDLLKKIVNVLYISGEEIDYKDVAKIVGEPEATVLEAVGFLKAKLDNIGLQLISNNNKLSIATSTEYADLLKEIVNFTIKSDLTPAQLQTLTIISYLESVTVADISFIRGVQSIQTVRALSTRGLIEKDKRSTEGLEDIEKDKYMLSTEALKYLGIKEVKELKDFDNIQAKLKQKMQEALNG
ncbi:MAG: segregation and condensation protein [Patescibacteria group bacterium]|nr:segregation and condensation protein [Patescibacteria group bacterium]